jgi:hypothetical protein
MTEACEMLNLCGFFKKYNETKNLACKGFIQMYCMGSQKLVCKRREYRRQTGAPPSDDMMPSGQLIV